MFLINCVSNNCYFKFVWVTLPNDFKFLPKIENLNGLLAPSPELMLEKLEGKMWIPRSNKKRKRRRKGRREEAGEEDGRKEEEGPEGGDQGGEEGAGGGGRI